VVAISHTREGRVYIFGRGVYEGDFPYEDVTSTEPILPGSQADAEYVERCIADESLSMTNPRIRLDSGKVVWGCECWWGDEPGFEKKYGGGTSEIVVVDVDEERAKANGHGVPDLVRGAAPR
jgi:hypothetical protein